MKDMDRNAALTRLDSCLTTVRRAQSSRAAFAARAARSGISLPVLSLSILASLHRSGPARMKVLVERVDEDLSRVSREVTALAQSGHVRRRTDDADGRAVVVELTRFGARQWTTYRNAVRGMLDDVVADWNDADVVRFADLFDRFLTALRPPTR